MNPVQNILFKTLIKPFYKQKAAFLIFIVIVMIGVVGELDGSDMVDYHYALILGILNNPRGFVFILMIWFIYAMSCFRFVRIAIQKKENLFLTILAGFETKRRVIILFFTQLFIYLPVLGYSVIVTIVAFYIRRFNEAALILAFHLLTCLLSVAGYSFFLRNHANRFSSFFDQLFNFRISRKMFGSILLKYLFINQKIVFAGLKLYDCAVLFLVVRNLSAQDYDMRLPFVLYSFGLFGHGILVYFLREFEEDKLTFLRTLPLSAKNRFEQYALLYGIMLIPEFLTVILLTPRFLHPGDAFAISGCSYSVLLLLNSLTLLRHRSVKDFLKISLGLFFILIFSVFTLTQIWISVLFAVVAILVFSARYFKYERGTT